MLAVLTFHLDSVLHDLRRYPGRAKLDSNGTELSPCLESQLRFSKMAAYSCHLASMTVCQLSTLVDAQLVQIERFELNCVKSSQPSHLISILGRDQPRCAGERVGGLGGRTHESIPHSDQIKLGACYCHHHYYGFDTSMFLLLRLRLLLRESGTRVHGKTVGSYR